MLMGPCYNLVSPGPSEKNGYACWSRDAELPKPGIAPRERGRGRSVTVSLVDYSKWESHFLSLAASREDWSRLDSVSDDYWSDWWFSLPPRRVLLASSVDIERLYRRRLAWKLVWGRDQEAAGQGKRGGEGDQGHQVQEESPA